MTAAESAAQPERRRDVSWHDPLVTAALAPTMSGLDYVRGMIDGAVPPPPIASLMRMRVVAADTGTTTFECDPDESHYNPIGTVHGGVACTLLDSAAGCAVQTTLPQGYGYTSIEIAVKFLRPILQSSGPLTCTATVTKPGRRVAFADVTLTDAGGTLLATASSSVLVFPF